MVVAKISLDHYSSGIVLTLYDSRVVTWHFELLPLPYQHYHEETVLILQNTLHPKNNATKNN